MSGTPAGSDGPGGMIVPGEPVAPPSLADLHRAVARHTPARLFLGGSAGTYPTATWLRLRADHASARDAVASTLDLGAAGLADFVDRHRPAEVATEVPDDSSYLRRPDLGRRLRAEDRRALTRRFAEGPPPDLVVAVAGGLSAHAVATNGPALVDALMSKAVDRGWRVGPVVVVHRARVGVLNDLGPATGAEVVVLLIGERPGLAASDTVSAYLAYRPRPGCTDADRNLVSGISDRGTPVAVAAARTTTLIEALRAAGRSGVSVKEPGRQLIVGGGRSVEGQLGFEGGQL